MTDVVFIRKTGPTTAEITFSVFRIGTFLTAGRTESVVVDVEDSDDLRAISANLNHLKTNNFTGLVNVNFGNGKKYQMDQSLWPELADALFAFSLCVDCANLGI
jgi:hypothetical protein